MNQVKGFVISIAIVIIVFVAAAVGSGLIAEYFGVWKKPVIGASAAFIVVLSGYITAPSHKQLAAVIWLIVGAISAWLLAGNSYYPEDYEHAYQPTMFPLLLTYLSGFIAVLLCVFWHKKRHNE